MNFLFECKSYLLNIKIICWTCKSHFRVPEEILEVPGPKKLWMAWSMTQKRISRKTSLAKYDFRNSCVACICWLLKSFVEHIKITYKIWKSFVEYIKIICWISIIHFFSIWVTQPAYNVPRTSPSGPVLFERFRTIIGTK